MNNAERIEKSVINTQNTIKSAMEYSMEHLRAFLDALAQLSKGSPYRQYTKKGPGRHHQSKSKAVLREEAYQRKMKEKQQ